MTDPLPTRSLDNQEAESPHYASFILRCWTSDLGQIRARLIDVHTGVSRPVTDLDELPGLVRHLVAQALPDQPEEQ